MRSARLPDIGNISPIPADLSDGDGQLRGQALHRLTEARPILADMDRYRIIPAHRAYRVVVMDPNGQTRIVRSWPTEEAAVSHLKALRERIERANRPSHPGEKDWRG